MTVPTICTSSDGENTEGIGALAQYQIFAFAYALASHANFKFYPFTNLQHYQHCGVTQQEFCDDVNELFKCLKESSKSGVKEVRLQPKMLMKFGQENLHFVKKALDPLNLCLPKSQKYFSDKDVNVALHLRTYTDTDCCTAPVREYLTEGNKESVKKYYSNILTKIKEVYYDDNIVLHVYGQGTEENHKFLDEIHDNVQYHIDEYPPITLYHMTNADILLMANSSFSYVPHLFNKSFTIAKPSFHHKLHENNTVRTTAEGDFDTLPLKQYKNERTN